MERIKYLRVEGTREPFGVIVASDADHVDLIMRLQLHAAESHGRGERFDYTRLKIAADEAYRMQLYMRTMPCS